MRRRYNLIGTEGGYGPVILLFFRGRSWGVYLSIRTPVAPYMDRDMRLWPRRPKWLYRLQPRVAYRLRVGVGPMFHWFHVSLAPPAPGNFGPEVKGRVWRVSA